MKEALLIEHQQAWRCMGKPMCPNLADVNLTVNGKPIYVCTCTSNCNRDITVVSHAYIETSKQTRRYSILEKKMELESSIAFSTWR